MQDITAPKTGDGRTDGGSPRAHGPWRLGIALVLALALTVLVFVAPFGRLVPPAQLLQNAFAETHRDMAAPLRALWEQSGLDAVWNGWRTRPIQQRLTLYAPSPSLHPAVKEVGMSLDVCSDYANRQLDATWSLDVARVPVFLAQMQLRDDVLAMKLPTVLSGSYGLRTTGMGADWNASALAGMLGVTLPEELGFNTFDMFDTFDEAARKENSTAFQALLQQAEIDRMGQERVEIDAVEYRCQRYSLCLDAKAAGYWLQEQTAFGGEATRSVIRTLLQVLQARGENPVGNHIDKEEHETIEKIWNFMQQPPNRRPGNWKVDIYLSERQVLKWVLRGQWEDEESPEGFSLAWERCKGQDAGQDAWRLRLQLGEEQWQLLCRYQLAEAGALSIEMQLQHRGRDGEEKPFMLECDWNPAAEEDNFALTLRFPSRDLSLEMRGDVLLDAAQRSLWAEFPVIRFTHGGDVVTLEGAYQVSPAASGWLPAWEPVLLLELDEEQLQALRQRMSTGMLQRIWDTLQAG